MPKTITVQTPFGPITQVIEDDSNTTTAIAEALISLSAKVDKLTASMNDVNALLIRLLLK